MQIGTVLLADVMVADGKKEEKIQQKTNPNIHTGLDLVRETFFTV